jgi:hypothetical protein
MLTLSFPARFLSGLRSSCVVLLAIKVFRDFFLPPSSYFFIADLLSLLWPKIEALF